MPLPKGGDYEFTEQSRGSDSIPYRIVRQYPHDQNAFTQGLAAEGGIFYESTGIYGYSEVRVVDIQTGRVARKTTLAEECFGEGLSELDGALYQLTWRELRGFIYDKSTLEKVGQYPLHTEGWGLTTHDGQLLMSDGTSRLYLLNADRGTQEPCLQVTEDGTPVELINDIAAVGEYVYANILNADRIIKIDLSNGSVVGSIDLSGLNSDPSLRSRRRLIKEAVLNGIAHDRQTGHIYVTGKLWGSVYEIELL